MSVFDEQPSQSPATPKNFDISSVPADREGFDWPTDKWFIERIMFLYAGGMTTFCIFLFIVTGAAFFLLIPMAIGVLQCIFAMTGFSILVKVLLALGIRQK